MNPTCEQISFITEEQKQDTRRNTLRLRERLMTEHGFEAFDDTEVLSTVLSYAKGTRDTAGVVNRLFDTFGSLKAILEARPEQLMSVDGMTISRASMISLIVPLTRVWHRCVMSDQDTLSRILGHADAAFTYKVYCHADQTSMKNGMEMMEVFVSMKNTAVNE